MRALRRRRGQVVPVDQHAVLRAPRVLVTVPPQRLFFAGTLSPRHATHAIRTQVDPDVYVVLDEKLFLFSNADARTAFENEEPGIVQVADGKWAEMESERAQKKGCFSCF